MLHIVLFEPQIPQNTGNVGRLCAVTRSRLHLIHPLGFRITDRQLKRAGMDYWHALDVHHHENWDAFQRSPARPRRLWLFTTKTKRSFWDVRYKDGDGLLFGNEGAGCPDWLHAAVGDALAQSLDGRGHRLLRGPAADRGHTAAGLNLE